MTEYILETKGLTKKYGNFTAVRDINLHVRKNDIYGFVGRKSSEAVMVIRVQNFDPVIKKFEEAGIRILSPEEVYGI